jgi:beta-glucosidase
MHRSRSLYLCLGVGIFLALAAVLLFAVSGSLRTASAQTTAIPTTTPPLAPGSPEEAAKVEEILAKMSTGEKVALIGGHAPGVSGIPSAGIPGMEVTDGPLGVRGGGNMVLPSGPLTGATFDPAIAEAIGTVISTDMLGRNDHCRVLLGPCINIHRTPLGGRNGESWSEDPYLAGWISAGYVKGVQEMGGAACVKHYACNNQEEGRGGLPVVVSERALREIYLPAFEMSAKEGKAWSYMAAYNGVNGFRMTANNHLENEILKGDWGSDGLIMSDWGATAEGVACCLAGLDLDMPGGGMAGAVGGNVGGRIPMSVLDDHARRFIRLYLRVQSLNHPTPLIPSTQPYIAQHQEVMLKAAQEGIILLKNDKVGDAPALPIDKTKVKKIAIIGPKAKNMPTSINGSGFVGVYVPMPQVYDQLKTRLGAGVTVTYAAGTTGDDKGGPGAFKYGVPYPAPPAPADDKNLQDAVNIAKDADVSIVLVGLGQPFEGEAQDRPVMGMPGNQDNLCAAVQAVCPRTIVVLLNGGVLQLGDWEKSVPGLLEAYYPGQMGGQALVDILLGEVNPSGHLPDTMGKKREDYCDAVSYPKANYDEGIYVGYRWFDNKKIEPLFPFGYGLSYTSFKYSNLKCTPDVVKTQKGPAGAGNSPLLLNPKPVEDALTPVTVTVDVENTGKVAGDDVVQLYVSDTQPRIDKAQRELKAFQRVSLKPGEKKTVTLTLDSRSFAYYDEAGAQWKADTGVYEVQIGESSRDIKLTGRLKLADTWTQAQTRPK